MSLVIREVEWHHYSCCSSAYSDLLHFDSSTVINCIILDIRIEL